MDAYIKDQFDFTGVKAALLVEQSILVILRDNNPAIPWPNMWELTGGGKEGQETPLECLQREVWEELRNSVWFGTKMLSKKGKPNLMRRSFLLIHGIKGSEKVWMLI